MQCSSIQELIALLPCSGQFIISDLSVVHRVGALCLVVTRIGHSTRLSSYAKHRTDTITLAVGEGFLSVTAKVKNS